MSTIESYDSYGVVGDGVVQNNNNNNNNNNSGPQASGDSVGVMPNMRLVYSNDGAAVYKPVMPPTPPHSASATDAPPLPTYQPGGDDGSAPPSINASTGEQPKRKRGRARKYAPDGTMPPVFVSPTPLAATESSRPSGKKRGRPLGSGRKQQVAALGSPGVGFTPHVITVKAGEDISSKIMSFSQNGTRAICILSANGAISNVTLRQAATSGGTVTYEGRFEILSLSGSYMHLESGGQRSRTGGLSVLLAGPDGRVLGGGVAGLLIAAAPVQVVVGCFISGQEELKSPNQADPLTAPAMLVPGASVAGSPGSRGTLSESSGGPGSPLNQSTGACNNNNPQGMANLSWN